MEETIPESEIEEAPVRDLRGFVAYVLMGFFVVFVTVGFGLIHLSWGFIAAGVACFVLGMLLGSN